MQNLRAEKISVVAGGLVYIQLLELGEQSVKIASGQSIPWQFWNNFSIK